MGIQQHASVVQMVFAFPLALVSVGLMMEMDLKCCSWYLDVCAIIGHQHRIIDAQKGILRA